MLRILSNYRQLRRSQAGDPERRRRSQWLLIDELVRIATRSVAYYRDRFSATGSNGRQLAGWTDFYQLPILAKADIKANFPDRMVSDAVDPRALYPVATSGTTDRVMLFHDEYKRDWDRAADLLLAMQGDRWRLGSRRMAIPPDACLERCGPGDDGPRVPLWRRAADFMKAERRAKLSDCRRMMSRMIHQFGWREKVLKGLPPQGTGTDSELLDTYLRSVRSWKPRVVSAFPMYLFILARQATRGKVEVSIPSVRPSGGKMTPEMCRVVEKVFRCRVRENYGTAELGTIAHDCVHNRQQHLIEELFHLEFVRGGRPVAPGEPGEILVTDLRNRVAPLIRYQVGDVGSYSAHDCECGRKGLLFTVHGRLDETLVLPDGLVFTGDRLVDFFLSQPGIDYVRLIQESLDRFVLEAVAAPSARELPSAEDLSRAFSGYLNYPVAVRLCWVRRITPERSGKFRLVLSSTYHQFHDSAAIRHSGERPPHEGPVGAWRQVGGRVLCSK